MTSTLGYVVIVLPNAGSASLGRWSRADRFLAVSTVGDLYPTYERARQAIRHTLQTARRQKYNWKPSQFVISSIRAPLASGGSMPKPARKTTYPLSRKDSVAALEATGVPDATKAYRVYHLTLYAATIGRQKRSSAGWLTTVANVQKAVLKGLRAK